MLFLGALIVIGLLLSPLWLEQFRPYIEEPEEQRPFPDAFYSLPNEIQDPYLTLYQTNPEMAVDFAVARLVEAEDIEEPNLALIDAEPVELLAGAFVNIDAMRGAAGTVTIYRLSDGRKVLRLNNLEAINGPELHVLLSAYANPTTKEDLDQVPQLQIDLGIVKSAVGNQNYLIQDPAFNADNYQEGSIVLYSLAYETVFSYASLIPSTTPE
jgi:hypothetical protein